MKRHRRDQSEVSYVIKYLVFGFNGLFWLLGAGLLAIGLWAWTEKKMFDNIAELSQIHLDPAFIFIIVGGIIFIIGFCGCVGALRENTLFLLVYCIAVGIIFFSQLLLGVLGFVYRTGVEDQIQNQLEAMIIGYRDDPDMQNLIDWVQKDWLKCCGVDGPDDWDKNMYFNSTSKSLDRCGVPFSCCTPTLLRGGVDGILTENLQCGFGVRCSGQELRDKNTLTDDIYTTGCLDAGKDWLNKNLIPVAAVAVGLALLQILGICCAQNLRSDIQAQRAKWR